MLTNAGKLTLTDDFQPAQGGIVDGDCGLLIQRDGKVHLFQKGMPVDALRKPMDMMSPDERQMLANGQLLSILSVVAASDELQQAILQAMVAGGVAGIETGNDNG